MLELAEVPSNQHCKYIGRSQYPKIRNLPIVPARQRTQALKCEHLEFWVQIGNQVDLWLASVHLLVQVRLLQLSPKSASLI